LTTGRSRKLQIYFGEVHGLFYVEEDLGPRELKYTKFKLRIRIVLF
jgi:hypothetical protein